jgi:3-hydroxyacyl-CoA dehydrogenase/enoyl-CoA hydratase/3-hydroxybutyryl-CoA epimerase
MGFINITVDGDGVATLTMKMEGKVNKINQEFIEGLSAAVDRVAADDAVKGIILASGHKDFCAGADIDMLFRGRDAAQFVEGCRVLNAAYRKLETCGKPVVAALTGSALGGGYELALACHHRIALNSGRIMVGLPEVSLGVLPGAGGTQRLPRLLGIQTALEYLAQGKTERAPKAAKVGLIDDLADTPEELVAKAKAWIAGNPGFKQPWDRSKRMKWPEPAPDSSNGRAVFIGACAMLFKKTAGAFPAPEAIVDVVREGSQLTFDRALDLEGRAFAKLATSDTAKDILRTFWYHRTAAERCEGLPMAEDHGFKKVGILGAGMMGAGLAFVCANRGYEVVLKDINADVLERAQAHCGKQASRKRHLSAEQQQAITDRITYTLELAPLEGCDIVIEAVVENIGVKHRVLAETEPLLAEGGVWASNTSALPITDLAKPSARPERFIGLHFFSPVEKMPLLEIIMGAQTDQDTLARCVKFARDIGKLPIVVNDGYGFYTSRVFSAYLMEGLQLVCEGHDPVLVEWAARTQGMVVPPLKVFDEVSLALGRHAFEQSKNYRSDADLQLEGTELVRVMVDEYGRKGKAHGAGFYDYEGQRRIWPKLSEVASKGRVPEETGVEYIGRRLMLAQIAQVASCLEEGILTRHRDAEVGAIFGIGFAPNTGGPLAWIDRQGVANVVAELNELAGKFGSRFTPAPVLVRMAENNERFFEAV